MRLGVFLLYRRAPRVIKKNRSENERVYLGLMSMSLYEFVHDSDTHLMRLACAHAYIHRHTCTQTHTYRHRLGLS